MTIEQAASPTSPTPLPEQTTPLYRIITRVTQTTPTSNRASIRTRWRRPRPSMHRQTQPTRSLRTSKATAHCGIGATAAWQGDSSLRAATARASCTPTETIAGTRSATRCIPASSSLTSSPASSSPSRSPSRQIVCKTRVANLRQRMGAPCKLCIRWSRMLALNRLRSTPE